MNHISRLLIKFTAKQISKTKFVSEKWQLSCLSNWHETNKFSVKKLHSDIRLIVFLKQMASQFREQPVTWEQENFRNWIAKRSSNVLFLHFILLCGNIFNVKPNKSSQISGRCGWDLCIWNILQQNAFLSAISMFYDNNKRFFRRLCLQPGFKSFFFHFLEFHFFSFLLVFTLVLALFLWWMERTPSSCEELNRFGMDFQWQICELCWNFSLKIFLKEDFPSAFNCTFFVSFRNRKTANRFNRKFMKNFAVNTICRIKIIVVEQKATSLRGKLEKVFMKGNLLDHKYLNWIHKICLWGFFRSRHNDWELKWK